MNRPGLALSILLLAVAACGAPSALTSAPTITAPPPPPSSTPVVSARTPAPATSTPTPVVLRAATATRTPSPTVTVSIPPTSTLASELLARLYPGSSSGTPTRTPGGSFAGIAGVEVVPVGAGRDGQPLWAAYTYGMRGGLTAEQSHFVAVYRYGDARWQQLGRVELKEVDFLGPGSVRRVQVEPSQVWLEADGGAGAHSGAYYLLRFDGVELRLELSHFHTTPGPANLTDLNGDGTPEVVLNYSNEYIFSYAAGVRLYQVQVLRWDGAQLSEVELSRLPSSAPAELKRLTDRAIDLANAELWKDAAVVASQIAALNPPDQAARWDVVLIRMHAEGRAEQATRGPYPLLGHVFYGDYPATVDLMRRYAPAQLFDRRSPLIVGTAAEGYEDQVIKLSVSGATRAIEVVPSLAAAYFVRGWALELEKPGSPAALADVKRSAELAPGDRLFAEGAAYLGRAR